MGAIARFGPRAPPALSYGAAALATNPPPRHPVQFRRPRKFTISGVTRDSAFNPLPFVAVNIFETINAVTTGEEPKGRFIGSTISNSVGAYSIEVYANPLSTFYADGYLSGAPDLAGTTINALTVVQVQ